MIEALAIAVAMLVAVGVHQLLDRRLFPAIIGLSLLANAANLIVLAAGGYGRFAPILGRADTKGIADPLPQAMVLTAIVISMAVTLYLVALLRAVSQRTGKSRVPVISTGDADRDPDVVARELGKEQAT
jgi:multicomponent Na+:H+ antiporter subunit C